MKKWLKWGLILSTIDLIIIIFAYVRSTPMDAKFLAVMLSTAPFSYLAMALGWNNFVPVIVFGLIGWFIIGSIIGWIIGKLKIKK